jgi:hypothetical protein
VASLSCWAALSCSAPGPSCKACEVPALFSAKHQRLPSKRRHQSSFLLAPRRHNMIPMRGHLFSDDQSCQARARQTSAGALRVRTARLIHAIWQPKPIRANHLASEAYARGSPVGAGLHRAVPALPRAVRGHGWASLGWNSSHSIWRHPRRAHCRSSAFPDGAARYRVGADARGGALLGVVRAPSGSRDFEIVERHLAWQCHEVATQAYVRA